MVSEWSVVWLIITMLLLRLLKAAKQKHPQATAVLDDARAQGLLRPSIPESAIKDDDLGTPQSLTEITFGPGVTSGCSIHCYITTRLV